MPKSAVMVVALLAGCGRGAKGTPVGTETSSEGGCLAEDDCDGDGWTQEQGDCDDTNPDLHPGADDLANDGVDSNCDGIDVIDRDRDGQAAAEHGGDDCDDSVSWVGLGFPEVCDGWDNDCDGAIDEDHPASIGDTPYDSIEAAIAAAIPEVSVDVCPGEWVVPTLDVSGVLLTGRGDDVTVLRAGDPAGPVLTASSGVGSVWGLRVTGATAGPGVRLTGGALRLSSIIVDGCRTGIEVVGGPGTVLSGDHTRVRDNMNPTGAGGGLYASGPVVVELAGSYEHNTALDGAGGALRDGATLVCGGSSFSGNLALRDGGGLHVDGATLAVPVDRVIFPCEFGGNEAGQDGGGAWLGRVTADPRAIGRITSNVAGRHGGGAALVATAIEDLTVDFAFNEAADGGALYLPDGSRATLSGYARVHSNDVGGGVRVTGSGEVSAAGVTVELNLPYDLATDLGQHTTPTGQLQVFTCTGDGGCVFR